MTIGVGVPALIAFAAAFALGRATRDDAPTSTGGAALERVAVADAASVSGLARAAPLPKLRPRATPTPTPTPRPTTSGPPAPAPTTTAPSTPAPTAPSAPASGGGGSGGGDAPIGGGGGGG